MEENTKEVKEVGRNEPCPCGSNKKYKRCHGVDAAPKLTTPAAPAMPAGAMPGGFDPNQMDPQMMLQFSQMLQRLPRGQMQKLQVIMQKAMSGKDVTREAAEFERTLPLELQTMLKSMGPQMMGAMGGGMGGGASMPAAEPEPEPQDMSVDQARKIVEQAVAEGKISREQADALLKKQ